MSYELVLLEPTEPLGYRMERLFKEPDLLLLQAKIEELESKIGKGGVGHIIYDSIQFRYNHSLPYAMLHLLPERLVEDREEQVLETLHTKAIALIDLYLADDFRPFGNDSLDAFHNLTVGFDDDPTTMLCREALPTNTLRPCDFRNLGRLDDLRLFYRIFQEIGLWNGENRTPITFNAHIVFRNLAWIKPYYPFLYPDYYWSAKQ